MFSGIVVDSAAFARDSEELRGSVLPASLQRLQDMLFDQSGIITYVLNGFMRADGKAMLKLEVGGELRLRCDRCLGPVQFRVQSDKLFELVPQEQVLSDPAEEPEDMELMQSDPRLDVIALVEDEVILGIPMVIRHAEGSCAAPVVEDASETKVSPFSVLDKLKRL